MESYDRFLKEFNKYQGFAFYKILYLKNKKLFLAWFGSWVLIFCCLSIPFVVEFQSLAWFLGYIGLLCILMAIVELVIYTKTLKIIYSSLYSECPILFTHNLGSSFDWLKCRLIEDELTRLFVNPRRIIEESLQFCAIENKIKSNINAAVLKSTAWFFSIISVFIGANFSFKEILEKFSATTQFNIIAGILVALSIYFVQYIFLLRIGFESNAMKANRYLELIKINLDIKNKGETIILKSESH